MRIAYIIPQEDTATAVYRRRLFALIPYWQKYGHEVFPWENNATFDIAYVVNLPKTVETALKVLATKAQSQALVVGMIEDLDTGRWASVCNEDIDSIIHLIESKNRESRALKGRLRTIRDWIAELGLMQTHLTKVKTCLEKANAVLSTSELQAASLRRYNPYVNGIADCIPNDDYVINDLDYKRLLDEKHDNNSIILVWEGTEWGLQLLELIRNPLNSVAEKSKVKIRIRLIMPRYRPPLFGETDNELIAQDRYSCSVERYDWDLKTVGSLIHTSDIGLAPMPLTNPFYRAKAFSKPLVYMAAGLPVIASAIPSYCELIQNGVSGFVAETQSEWYEALIRLTTEKKLRVEMGMSAKKRVEDFHSVEKVASKIMSVFLMATQIEKI